VSRHRPNTVIVEFCGVPHSLDLLACRRALVRHQVEGEFFTLAALGVATGISRSTVSRFFSGRVEYLPTVLKVLAALGLSFDEVATPCTDAAMPD
jgi:transcriptional regulator with XRE-family HTH domain